MSESGLSDSRKTKLQRTVLFVVGTGDLVGGAQVSLLNLVSFLDPSRYEAVVLAPRPGTLTAELASRGTEVLLEPMLGERYLKGNYRQLVASSLRTARLLRKRSIALVHNNTWLPGARVVGLVAARFLARVPYLHHERDIWTPNRRADRMTARFATKIVSISNAVSEKYRRLGAESRIVKVFNGVDTQRFSSAPTSSGLLEELKVSSGAPVVGIFSRISREKGHLVFLEAAARVVRVIPDARFLIVGRPFSDGNDYGTLLESRVRELGLDQTVTFLGFRDDVPELMRLCRITVCPSDFEPFGRVVIESMACGRPVIATSLGGPLEIIQDGETGLFAEMGNVEQWADRMLQLLRSPKETEAMGVAAREDAVRRFDIRQHAERMQDLFDELLAK